MSRRILIIDDEDAIGEIARVGLEAVGGWRVATACSGEEELPRAGAERPDAHSAGYEQSGAGGPTTLQKLRANPAIQLTSKAGMSFSFMGIMLATARSIKDSGCGLAAGRTGVLAATVSLLNAAAADAGIPGEEWSATRPWGAGSNSAGAGSASAHTSPTTLGSSGSTRRGWPSNKTGISQKTKG
jgi:CheY-like chemotaxis protein